jgi:uncharacterized membrane protein YadS
MAAAVTWVPALRPAGRAVAAAARQAMVLTLFLVGAGLTRDALRKVGVRPLVLGTTLWAVVSTVALAVVRVTRPG